MDIVVTGRPPWFSGPRAALALELRRRGHFVWERDGMPPVGEHDALVVIGTHDHGPPPAGMPSVGIRTEQCVNPGDRQISASDRGYTVLLDIFPERARENDCRSIVPWCEWEPGEPAWDAPRTVDVLWYGTPTPRRKAILTELCSKMTIEQPCSFLGGEDKRRALGETKIALAIHAYDTPSSEPFRYAEAAACGALLVVERPQDCSPWAEAKHMVAFDRLHALEALRGAIEAFPRSEAVRRRAFSLALGAASPAAAAEKIEAVLEGVACRA